MNVYETAFVVLVKTEKGMQSFLEAVRGRYTSSLKIRDL